MNEPIHQNDSPAVELNQFRSELSLANRLTRLVWGWVWVAFFLPSPRVAFGWRRFLLKLFGAKVASGVRVYSTAMIYYPANLELGENAIVGPFTNLYCVNRIRIESNSMVSQYSYLCTASHDYTRSNLPLTHAPITVESNAWVCADVFVGPGVTIGEGAVVGARSTAFRDIEPWSVVAGNPAKFIKRRTIAE